MRLSSVIWVLYGTLNLCKVAFDLRDIEVVLIFEDTRLLVIKEGAVIAEVSLVAVVGIPLASVDNGTLIVIVGGGT